MNPQLVITLIIAYFGILIVISRFTRKEESSHTFFTGNRDTPWYIIAFGMIGTSISGVTFISIPGAVGSNMFDYMQVVLGYWVGYLAIVYVLLPLYYRLNLTSIYQYLEQRFGTYSYKAGASLFLISRLMGASLRLCVVAIVLQELVFTPLGVPFWVSVLVSVLLIYVYTFQSGVKTVIWTDTVQTVGLLAGLIISIIIICQQLNWGIGDMASHIVESKYSQSFFWDWQKANYFPKMFFGGMAVAIAMTGLDQDMMQKNLACRNLADAQKNMHWFAATLIFVNLLFLCLGALLYLYGEETGLLVGIEKGTLILNDATTPSLKSDQFFTYLANHKLGQAAAITFVMGVIAAAYSSADSAMTALTTSVCIDILDFEKKDIPDSQKRNTRYLVHICIAFLTFLIIMVFQALNDDTLIGKILKVAGYTYGPLLGLYTFGLYTKRKVIDKYVPIICVISPIICYFLQFGIPTGGEPFMPTGSYKLGLELMILNALLTFVGLWAISKKE